MTPKEYRAVYAKITAAGHSYASVEAAIREATRLALERAAKYHDDIAAKFDRAAAETEPHNDTGYKQLMAAAHRTDAAAIRALADDRGTG